MKFAENNRISQRQLYRQIVIAFIAPFLLCLFRGRRNQGLSGLTGTLLAVAVFLFYVIFLIRLGYAFANPCKTAGKILGRLMGIFYLVYCILGAAFLLDLLGEIVSVSLGTGVQKVWLCVIALIVCSLGTHRGNPAQRADWRGIRRTGACGGCADAAFVSRTGKMGVFPGNAVEL